MSKKSKLLIQIVSANVLFAYDKNKNTSVSHTVALGDMSTVPLLGPQMVMPKDL